MARMIPDVPVAATGSSAELRVFKLLQHELPDDFHVYHSVAFVLSGGCHHAPREGEIDFLITHRELGLLAMEVKGGHIGFDGRRRLWTSTSRGGHVEVIDDPFRQAQSGIHALLREINRRRVFGADPPDFAAGHCVGFPDCKYDTGYFPPDCPADLVIDEPGFGHLKHSIEAIMVRPLKNAAKKPMTRQQMKLLAQRVLAPRFQLGLSLQREFAWEERALRLLTEEQAICLDFLALNPRAVVQGPAGTGKTLVALEHARREAEHGARVLLLCFNLPLAQHLRAAAESFDGLPGSIWAGAYHELCRQCAEEAGLEFTIPASPDSASKFWDEDSSLILADALGRLSGRFDVLVVDEAQDMHEGWWQVLPELLRSPKQGGMVLLHDPEQNIYGRSGQLPLERPMFPLRLNCRCTFPLGRYAAGLAGVACRSPLFTGGGEEPHIATYKDADDEYSLVDRRIATLLEADIRPDQIVVLGTRRLEHSFMADRPNLAGLPVYVLGEQIAPPGAAVCYSTLHRFKGLEADVVLLCDVDGHAFTSTRRHVYVGASRAKHRLYLFCTPAMREADWIKPNRSAVAER